MTTDLLISARSGRSRRIVSVLIGAAVLSLVAVACAPPPPPPHRIDVDNPPMPVIGGLVTSNHWSQIQTFTAGATGVLDQVNLWIQFTGPGDLLVEVHEVNGTYDLGALIGSANHNGPETGEVAIPLNVPANVVAGHRYAIALRQMVSESSGSWQLSFSDSVQLPGETFYVHYDNGTDVFMSPGKRMSLRTWIRPW